MIEKIENLSSALNYLHSVGGKNIIHGDLRPETIMLSMGTCKTSPMNPAKIEKSTSLIHSFVCPEALAEQPLTTKSDMWNLGLIIYKPISNYPLFRPQGRDNPHSLTDQIVNVLVCVTQMDLNKEISALPFATNPLKQLIKGLLKVRPDDRLSSAEILSLNLLKLYGVRTFSEEARR